jgi:hypothetical protein
MGAAGRAQGGQRDPSPPRAEGGRAGTDPAAAWQRRRGRRRGWRIGWGGSGRGRRGWGQHIRVRGGGGGVRA